jgi:peptide/nickel transport system substrate-binding protein
VLVLFLTAALIITGCSTPSATPSSPPSAKAPAASSAGSPTAAPKTTAPPAASATPSKYGGTLRWIEAVAPTTPIGVPAECSGPSGLTSQLALQTLLKEQLDGSITPGLAASYDVVTDAANPSITFRLQKGVKFSDGTDYNAAAAKWNLDKIKLSTLFPSTTNNWKSIEIVDDYSVRVNFVTWQNGVIRSFSDGLSYQISPAAFDKNGIDYMRWHLVGTGPFMQTDFQRDVSLTTVKNPNYWEAGKPYLDGFKYFFVSDESTRTTLYKSGGAEVLQTNGNGRVANELKDAGFNIVTQQNGPNVLVMDSANADSPWSNLKVRQAAEYAIDKEALSNTFGFGWWKAIYQFSNANSKAYDPTITPRKFDVAKAKQLLAEAGYPTGFKTTIIASPLQLNKNVVLAIQDQLSVVGIQAEVQFPEMAKWTEVSSNPWKNALLYTSVFDRGNQNDTFTYFLGVPATTWKSAARPAGWKEALDASKASPAQDPVQLKKLENMINNEMPCIPLISSTSLWAMTKNVQDTGEGTRGQSNWIEPQNAWLSK